MNQPISLIKENNPNKEKEMNKFNLFRCKLVPIDKERTGKKDSKKDVKVSKDGTVSKDGKVSKDAKIFPIASHIMNFDGCSKGNPGFAGIGAVIYNEGQEVWASSKFIGLKTNNYSEYSALIFGLSAALNMGIKSLSVLGDSLLVINQLNGIYKVKSEELLPLYEEAIGLKNQFKFIEFNHVYREKNKRADELSNIALLQIDTVVPPVAASSFTVTGIKGTEPFTKHLDSFIQVTDDWLEEEKLEEIIVKRPSKRLAKLTATKIDSFFPSLKKI